MHKKAYLSPETIYNAIEFYEGIATIVDPGISTSMNLGKRRENSDDLADEEEYLINSSTDEKENPLW